MDESDRLRVLQIGINWFAKGSGGLDRVFHDLVQTLPQAGVQTTGLVSAPCDVAALTAGRVQSMGRGGTLPARLWQARRSIHRLLRTGRFDVVAAHFALFAAPALDQLRRCGLVVHFHGPWAAESIAEGGSRLAGAGKRALERLVYRRADRVIVLSDTFAAIAVESYGVHPDRIRRVPGGTNLARFAVAQSRVEARESLGWPADRPILLTVRRLAARMGLDRLLDALRLVVAHCPDVLLMVAGSGQMAAALRAQVTAQGLEANVCFLGFLAEADLPLAFRAADLVLVPSLVLEGFGLTTVEALAAGTPVLVTPVGGLPDVVRALSPALVFASTAAAEMADRIVQALQGRLALPSEHACRAYAAAHFGVERVARATAAVYREVA